jgi:hypothetical protein
LRRWLLWQGNLQKSSPSGANLEVAVPPRSPLNALLLLSLDRQCHCGRGEHVYL